MIIKRLKRSKWTMSDVVIGYWACVCLLRNASYYVIFLFYLKLDFDMKLFEKIEIYILKDIVGYCSIVVK